MKTNRAFHTLESANECMMQHPNLLRMIFNLVGSSVLLTLKDESQKTIEFPPVNNVQSTH